MHTRSLCFVLVATLFTCVDLLPLPVSPGVRLPLATAQTVHTSDLWGQNGEKWHPSNRLPDFSFAGYHAGDKAIPTIPVKANVKDFGAKGDGKTDDTQAFKKAIAATSNGALLLPEGRYKISNILEINEPNVVLRGAGEGKTVLVITRSLGDVLGSVPYGRSAFLMVNGKRAGTHLAEVTAPADRGERTLILSSTAGITAGQMVRLRLKNPPDDSLGCYLYADQGCLTPQRQSWFADAYNCPDGRKGEACIVDWVVKVQQVKGNTVTLERPLRLDVRPQWRPTLWQHAPHVQEVGIEHLSIEFPNVQYGGHGHWAGYYAIVLHHVFHSWIRHVTITDADRGIEINGGGHNTVTQVTLATKWRKASANPTGDDTTGHYGFAMNGLTQDNLVSESEIRTVFDHNMSVTAFANGNVYAGIMSQNGRLDHHGAAPYENLFTEIVLTERASDLFKSGGNRPDEPNSGARTTFWNVVTLGGNFPSSYNTSKFPQLNVIGIDRWATKKTADKEWIERWPGTLTSPLNLYEAQLRYRQNRGDNDVPPPPPVVDEDTNDDDPPAPPVPDPTPSGAVQLWLEAEAGTLNRPMVVASDAEASGGRYIWVPNGSGGGGKATYRFSVPRAGSYAIWGRVISNSANDDSFMVALDDASTPVRWNTRHGGQETWVWDTLPLPLALEAGPHTLTISRREDGTKLDALLITDDLSFVPEALEKQATLRPEPPPVPNPAPERVVQLWLEAETGTLNRPMVVASDAQASGDRYIWVPNGIGGGGKATYRFSVPQAGSYAIWGRVISNSANDDSFWVALDDASAPIRWNTRHGGQETWVWDTLPLPLDLEAGPHTLTISRRENGTKLDALLITSALSFVPE